MLDRHFGKYELIRRLGRGGMADVYLAQDTAHDRQVAIKLVEIQPDRESREICEAERRGAILQEQFGRIDPHVPQVHEYGTCDGHFYIDMEYVEGEDLAERIARGPISADHAAAIAGEICAFLEKAHAFETRVDEASIRGIIHGDIKPKNVRLNRDGQVKILDFGIAKGLSLTRKLTRNDFGSLAYLSPERLDSGEVDFQADCWSVGVLLYEMIAGVPPFDHQDAQKLEHLIRSRQGPPPLPDTCPAGLVRIVLKMLAPTVGRRYRDAGTICRDLAAFRTGDATEADRSWLADRGETEPTRRTRPPREEVASGECRVASDEAVLAPRPSSVATGPEAVLGPRPSSLATDADVASGECRVPSDEGVLAPRPSPLATDAEVASGECRVGSEEAVLATRPSPLAPEEVASDECRVASDECRVASDECRAASEEAVLATLPSPLAPEGGASAECRVGSEAVLATRPSSLATDAEAVADADATRRTVASSAIEAEATRRTTSPVALDTEATRRTTAAAAVDADATRRTVSAASVTQATAQPVVATVARRRLPLLLRRAIAAGVALLFFLVVFLVWNETKVASAARELRVALATGQGSDVNRVWEQYQDLSRRSLLGLGLTGVRGPLKERLAAQADQVISDYRQDAPTVREAQWRTAADALTHALQLDPGDRTAAASLQYCEGHLLRIAGEARLRRKLSAAEAQRNAETLRQAVVRFQDAARLNTRWPDPYLGLARVYIYGLDDLDKANDALKEAEQRGYRRGNRELVQLADGYRRRGARMQAQADQVRGLPQEAELLQKAADDFQQSLDLYGKAIGFGEAGNSLKQVQRQLDTVKARLVTIGASQSQDQGIRGLLRSILGGRGQ